jgi:hypothetical protein
MSKSVAIYFMKGSTAYKLDPTRYPKVYNLLATKQDEWLDWYNKWVAYKKGLVKTDEDGNKICTLFPHFVFNDSDYAKICKELNVSENQIDFCYGATNHMILSFITTALKEKRKAYYKQYGIDAYHKNTLKV